jgi:hypothetical protein
VSVPHPSSFRDPAGYLYQVDGRLVRQINLAYRYHYDHLLDSGLYDALVERGLLISHREVAARPPRPETAYRVIEPELVPFLSYPYEWCFSQYRDAALATLEIQELALEHGMSLKDASAFNIQFLGARPMLIDTLSFELYPADRPWVAYRQFCEHFLAPLALMSYRDPRLGQLMRANIGGVPLGLAASLLPARARLRPGLLSHVFLHAASQRRYSDRRRRPGTYKMSLLALRGLVENLESTIRKLKGISLSSAWSSYYDESSYEDSALASKQRIVTAGIERYQPSSVWDLGANTGLFSRLASDRGIPTMACDSDPEAVEVNYLECRQKKEADLLPLIVDLTNPSPGLGWAHEERASLLTRGPADLALALALIHHLAIGNNVPFDRVAAFLSRLCRRLIIEWVPKSDSQVQRLLSTREDIFGDYARDRFETSFAELFSLDASAGVEGSERVIYQFSTRQPG